MRNAIEPRLLLVVGANDVPGSMLAIGGLQHHVAGSGVFIPAAKRLQIHGAEFPLSKWVFDTRLEAALLLCLPNLHPILDENDAGIHDVLFHQRTDVEETAMLFFGTEAHHIFHAGAVVPTPIENRDLSSGREML